ncbi:uncharacterized protein LOC106674078 [Cimex lectularius]|uniref:Uncharacterized protein n=1 Tax=Cimex lectularius TaxID=79782 RepID=A0A8I6SDS9_CIMLE|nr:uncharacterized protein LOC106674078 [Cimex lectularius]XP_014262016.1 uncharacterized protein LOC106674078 [Cimex lectularius]
MSSYLMMILAFISVGFFASFRENHVNGQVVFRPLFVYKHKQQEKLNNRREQQIQQQLIQAEQAEFALQQQQQHFFYDPYYYQYYYQHSGQYYPVPYPEINRISRNRKIDKAKKDV